jgi:hypothetical protein
MWLTVVRFDKGVGPGADPMLRTALPALSSPSVAPDADPMPLSTLHGKWTRPEGAALPRACAPQAVLSYSGSSTGGRVLAATTCPRPVGKLSRPRRRSQSAG